MIVCPELELLFIQVPQTGCSAIGRELVAQYGGLPVGAKHATLDRARARLGDDVSRMFVVSSIRNPLDQAVSSYHKAVHAPPAPKSHVRPWSGRFGSTPSERREFAQVADFSTYFLRFYRRPFAPVWLQSQRASDLVLRFEALQTGFEQMLAAVGSSPVRELPHFNKTPRPARPFEDFYDGAAQARATQIFGPFMSEWDYAMPPSWPVQARPRRVDTWGYRVLPHLKTGRSAARRVGRRAASLLR